MVADSGRPGAEWVERGLANLAARTPPDCLQLIHEESGMRLCGVGDAYDSSRALLLDTLLPEGSAEGFFVALPGRDEMLVLPVTGPALAFLHLLKGLAEKNYKSAPYSISDEVFWVRAGAWRLFPVRLKGDQVTLEPPEEFVAVLRRLVPEDKLPPLPDEEAPGAEEPS
jgi:hypothetical protein